MSPWVAGGIGCVVGFGIAAVGIPVVTIVGLTLLGASLENQFGRVAEEVGAAE